MTLADRKGKLTVYLGHLISPRSASILDDIRQGALAVDESGRILFAGAWKDLQLKLQAEKISGNLIDFGQKLILPGMIDLHIHLVQFAQTGRSGESLLGWLEKYIFPAEMQFCDRNHAERVATWFFEELARNGTTLSTVFTSIHAESTEVAFERALAKGYRVIMGKTMMDRNCPQELKEATAASLSQSEELCRRWHGAGNGLINYAWTPRFAPTSTDEMLKAVGGLWKKYPGTYMQTHLSENSGEIAWVKELYPQCLDYLDVYNKFGLTGPRSIFAHSIHLSDREFKEIKHSDCSLAHCPSSNFFLKSGRFKLEAVRQHGLKFGLGSDVAAGPEMSLFKVMRDAAYMQNEIWLDPRELLYMATLSGAEALGLDSQLGSLEAGKDADFIVVNPTEKSSVPKDILGQSTDNILSSLVYLGDDRMVEATFVRGKAIYLSGAAAAANETSLVKNSH